MTFQDRMDSLEKRIKGSFTLESSNGGRVPSELPVRPSTVTSTPPVGRAPQYRSFELPLIGKNTVAQANSKPQPSNPPHSSVEVPRSSMGSFASGSPQSASSSPGDCGYSSMFTRSTSASCIPGAPRGLELGFSKARPGSANSNQPCSARKRNFVNLDLGPPVQNTAKSEEIEKRYAEIMKKAGVLTINGQKIQSDLSELDPIGELGQGTCGHVVKMVHRKTKQIMAVKQMRRSGNAEDNKRIIMDLDVVMKSHSCPYIVHCIGAFVTSTDVWICMELMATCLDKLSKSLPNPIPENILGKVTVATVNALNYLKEIHGVIHRDVKPSNILLDERGNIKLCDFGISGHLVDSMATNQSAGCAAYMAPERIVPPDPSKPHYDIRADVWSLGLSLVELASGEFPYKNCSTDFEMLTKVLEDEQPALPPGKNFTVDFRDFVSKCLTKDFHNRPKYKQLLDHNFVRRYSSLPVDVGSWYKSVTQNAKGKNSTGPS